MVDSLLLFIQQMRKSIGQDKNKLFGISGVSLKDSEIFVNSQKGIDCFSNLTWPLRNLVFHSVVNVIINYVIEDLFSEFKKI